MIVRRLCLLSKKSAGRARLTREDISRSTERKREREREREREGEDSADVGAHPGRRLTPSLTFEQQLGI